MKPDGFEGATEEQQSRLATHPDEPRDGCVVVGVTFSTRHFNNVSAQRGYFADCLFRNCHFEACDFRRCDFEAVVFEKCTFIDCNFGSADFRSCEFSGCNLQNVQFPNGAIKSSSFLGSNLIGCRFYRQGFEENRLVDCAVTKSKFHRSTVLHTEFIRCTFDQTALSDCTSLYHIFDECIFTSSDINIDSVPLTFGLTRDNLSSVRLVWQGRRLPSNQGVEDLLLDLLRTTATRRWGVPACTLAVNFSLASTRKAFGLALSSLAENIRERRPIRVDELRFLARIVEILSSRGELPFLAVVQGLDLCAEAAEINDGSVEAAFRPLAHALKDAELAAIAAWETTMQPLAKSENRVLTAEFVFDVRPEAELVPVLDELTGLLDSEHPRPTLGYARSGSYIEVVYLSVGTLAALTISAGMLVRMVDHLIMLRGKIAILTGERLPVAVRRRALEPSQSPSAELAREMRVIAGALLTGRAPLTEAGIDTISAELRQINVAVAEGGAPSAP